MKGFGSPLRSGTLINGPSGRERVVKGPGEQGEFRGKSALKMANVPLPNRDTRSYFFRDFSRSAREVLWRDRREKRSKGREEDKKDSVRVVLFLSKEVVKQDFGHRGMNCGIGRG